MLKMLDFYFALSIIIYVIDRIKLRLIQGDNNYGKYKESGFGIFGRS